MPEPKFPEIEVQLTDQDGNAFAVIGAVREALRRAGQREAATAFVGQAFNCASYDALLQLVLATVTVR